MAICGDRGDRHSMALSRLATGNDVFRGDNHIVPVLHQITHGDMTFAVFPLMATGFSHPWHYCFAEVVGAVEQVLEVRILYSLSTVAAHIGQQGISFCHERLVAHLVRTSPPCQ